MKKKILIALGLVVSVFTIAQIAGARINNPPAAGISSLTPWTSNIDGGGFSLSNVLKLTSSNATTTLITAHTIFGDATDGLILSANNGTQVASFGVANSANTAFNGGVTIATTLGVTGVSSLATTTVSKTLAITGSASTGSLVNTDGATITVDWSKGNRQEVVLGATGRTLAFSNVVAGQVLELWVWQDGTGSRTITTYPSGVHWPAGTAPTLTTTAHKFDRLVFTTSTSTTQFAGAASANY